METIERSVEDRERDLIGELYGCAMHFMSALQCFHFGDPNGMQSDLERLKDAAEDAQASLHAYVEARWPKRPE